MWPFKTNTQPPGVLAVEWTDWTTRPCQAAADAILESLDDDLAGPVRDLPLQRRITDSELLAVQQIRLMRQLLEKLQKRDKSGEASSNG